MRFSVIVPVYNVADYLPACVDSLLRQDLSDAEIILVDDGSTDGKSGQLCDRFAAEHPGLIRTVHRENGGLGAARNSGVEQARGDYLLFLDSDDTLADDTLARLSEEIDRTNADMVIFGFRYVWEDGTQSPAEPRFSAQTGTVQTLADTPLLLLDPPMACTRLCRRSLFTDNGIRFPGRVWYEDLCTTPKLLLKAQSIVQMDAPFYLYLQRTGSIMRSANLRRNLEIINALETVRRAFDEAGRTAEFYPLLCTLAANSLLGAARRVLVEEPKADYLPDFLNYLKTTYPDYRGVKELALLGRKKLILLRLLEGGHYRTAKRIFALTARLHRK